MNVGAILRLVRPPNVFTAIADGLAGLLVLRGLGLTVPDRACLTLVASACLYLAGIVLNDVFDRHIDARIPRRAPDRHTRILSRRIDRQVGPRLQRHLSPRRDRIARHHPGHPRQLG